MNHSTANRRTRLAGIAAAAAAALLTLAVSGCQSGGEPVYTGDKPVGATVFEGQDMSTRSLNRITNAQAAAAARNDSTLRPYDFYGSTLNGLGQQKLDLMTLDERPIDEKNPLVVYMDMPEDTTLDDRTVTVAAYLKDKGLKTEQIKIEKGANPSPENASPAAPGLKTLHLLDGGAQVSNPEPATGGQSSGSPAASSGASSASASH